MKLILNNAKCLYLIRLLFITLVIQALVKASLQLIVIFDILEIIIFKFEKLVPWLVAVTHALAHAVTFIRFFQVMS